MERRDNLFDGFPLRDRVHVAKATLANLRERAADLRLKHDDEAERRVRRQGSEQRRQNLQPQPSRERVDTHEDADPAQNLGGAAPTNDREELINDKSDAENISYRGQNQSGRVTPEWHQKGCHAPATLYRAMTGGACR